MRASQSLRKKMPVTFWTFLAGTIALAGVWPLSGFFSKDAILAQALAQKTTTGYALFGVGWFVAILTAFYMFRLVFVVFFGVARDGDTHVAEKHGHAHATGASQPHEPPGVMVWPLRILGVFSVIGGWIGIEELFHNFFAAEPEKSGGFAESLIAPFTHAPGVASLGLLAAAVGIFTAYKIYAKAASDPLPAKLGALSRAMANRFYFDELYEATVIRTHDLIAAVCDWIDRWIVEGLCIGLVRGGTDLTGRALRLVQTGNLQTYAFLFVLGVAVVLWFVLGK